ncbi:MAG: toprim domain-containing protein [Fibromonadales bacterium]|nr:toprim domain-containing protein [Fibromonadales bacterium]
MYSITAVAQRLGLNVVRGRFRCFFSERHAHGDRTPSVSINEEKGYFKCFVCSEVKGKAVKLVELAMGISRDDAIKWLKDDSPSIIRDSQKFFLKKREKSIDKPTFFKEKMIFDFLSMLSPIPPYSAIGWWLAKRGIYKPTWDKMLLRCLDDYNLASDKLLAKYSLEDLQIGGLFNSYGKLRYGRRPLIIPYIDEKKRPFFFQARAIDKSVQPKELNFQGTIPFPYNKSALDGKPGTVYLCEGPIDTLTLLQRGFCAVGIPGANTFKPEWTELFKNKNVVLCLDNDNAGRAGEERISALLKEAGLDVRSFGLLPEGEDINSWFIRQL